MLALTVTFLTAIYLLGPDLVSRYILGFAVPRKTIQQTRSEEISRAILTAAIPLALAVFWATSRSAIDWDVLAPDVKTFFSGICSEKLYEQSPEAFFAAVAAIWRANWSVMWRLYLLLIVYAIVVNVIITNYGAIRTSRHVRNSPLIKRLLAIFVLPRVSEWHVLLTGFSHKKGETIRADILTKNDVLYRGKLEEPLLAPDGSLSGLLLSNPVRFQREQYIDDVKTAPAGKKPLRDDYWRKIPSQTFLIMAAEIETINLRHSSLIVEGQLMQKIEEVLNTKLTGRIQNIDKGSASKT